MVWPPCLRKPAKATLTATLLGPGLISKTCYGGGNLATDRPAPNIRY
jgi:hypothetical protein